MGRDKSRLKLDDGTSYLEHALARIREVCDEVAISCAKPVAIYCHVIVDPVAHQGPAVGIAASLRFASQNGFDGCLLTPVDMPNLTAADVQLLHKAWTPSGRLVVARSDRIQPLVGVYPTSLLSDVERVASSVERSMMKWILTQNYVAVDLSDHACLNVNTPEDLPHDS